MTFNLVSFKSYLNYDKPRNIGYMGTKIGMSYGAGFGLKFFNVGYRWISAGGGNISYSSIYGEVMIPIKRK